MCISLLDNYKDNEDIDKVNELFDVGILKISFGFVQWRFL